MRPWMKASMLALFVFAATWAGAVWYWRATNRMPSTTDLLAYMLALPLSVLLAIWVGRRLAALPAPAAAATAAPQEQAAAAAPARLPSLAVLASSIRTPHGLSAPALDEALAEGRARADLDPELLDDEGYPLMTLRADDALDAALRKDIEDWLLLTGLPDPAWSAAQWRALVLGSAVASELALHAAGHPDALAGPEDPQAPLLHVHAFATADWNVEQCATAAAWLSETVVQAGWPEDKVRAVVMPPLGVAPGASLLTELAAQAEHGAEPVLALVLAFGSHIGADSVDEMARAGQLFAAGRPQGRIPGEGAAGLLLADAWQARLFAEPAPLLQVAFAPHQGGAAGRPDAALLRRLADELLPGSGDAAMVTAVYADTGHRTAPIMELMALSGALLPHLDPGLDVHRLGAACGACGDAPFLAALALAHQHALETGAAALCVANEAEQQRSAALVRPAAPPDPSGQT